MGGSPATVSSTADPTGTVSFNLSTVPGMLYDYTVATGGMTVASGTLLAGSWEADASWFLTMPDGAGVAL